MGCGAVANKALTPGSGREIQVPAVASVVASCVKLRQISRVGHRSPASCRSEEKSCCGKLGGSARDRENLGVLTF
jgi:hypothetical protein